LKEFILGMEQAGAVDPKVLSGRWRDEEITLAEITLATPVGDVVSFAAQIPLKREAIQILAMGPTDAREEALGYLNQVLDSLEGKTAWGHSFLGRLDKEGRGIAVLGISGGIVVGGLVVLWRLGRFTGRGGVLGASVVCWVIGHGTTKAWASAEGKMIGGALMVLASCGLILGVLDLSRRRGRPHASPPDQTEQDLPPRL